jgi:hypothetical protein
MGLKQSDWLSQPGMITISRSFILTFLCITSARALLTRRRGAKVSSQLQIDRDGIKQHRVFSSNKRKTRSNNNNKQIR